MDIASQTKKLGSPRVCAKEASKQTSNIADETGKGESRENNKTPISYFA
jgi:hypothetical protein